MIFKVSKKYMREKCPRMIQVGYCRLQDLLQDKRPVAFTETEQAGWRCSYYNLFDIGERGRLVISTGYSPIGKAIDDELVDSFNEQAKVLNTKEERLELLKIFKNTVLKKYFS